MKLLVNTGDTDRTVQVFIQDAASLIGGGYVADTGSLVCYYSRVNSTNDVDTAAISLTSLASLTAPHTDGGIYPVDTGNMPGVYRLDLPDALFAATIESSVVSLRDTNSSGVTVMMEFEMAGMAGGLVTADANNYIQGIQGSLNVLSDLDDENCVRFALLESDISSVQSTVDAIPNTSEFNARTIPSGDYFVPATDTVATVTTVTNMLTADNVWSKDLSGESCDGTAGGMLYCVDDAAGNIYTDTQQLLTDVADVPTVVEFEERTIPSGTYLTDSSVWTYGSRTLSASGLESVLVDTLPLPSSLQIMGAVLAGKITTAGTAIETFVGLDGVTNRAVITVDASGNRTDASYP